MVLAKPLAAVNLKPTVIAPAGARVTPVEAPPPPVLKLPEPKPTKLYRSNVIPHKILDRGFPHLTQFPVAQHCPPSRHVVLHDAQCHPGALCLTHDEAALVYECARVGVDGPWLDVGSGMGWGTAHIALAKRSVVALDPAYENRFYTSHGLPNWLEHRTTETLAQLGLDENTFLFGDTLEEFADNWGGDNERYVGFLLDGDFKPGAALRDAKLAYRMIDNEALGGCILLHDGHSKDVQEAARWLVERGLKLKIYCTPYLLLCIHWGEFVPPDHEPDPDFNWPAWLVRMRFGIDLLRAGGMLPSQRPRVAG